MKRLNDWAIPALKCDRCGQKVEVAYYVQDSYSDNKPRFVFNHYCQVRFSAEELAAFEREAVEE